MSIRILKLLQKVTRSALQDGEDVVVPNVIFSELIREMLAGHFDEQWYLSIYPDVEAAMRDGKLIEALDHYSTVGYVEGRIPLNPKLDEARYLVDHPDVLQATANGWVPTGSDHFIRRGFHEGRQFTQEA
jgi:hypothetical protein